MPPLKEGGHEFSSAIPLVRDYNTMPPLKEGGHGFSLGFSGHGFSSAIPYPALARRKNPFFDELAMYSIPSHTAQGGTWPGQEGRGRLSPGFEGVMSVSILEGTSLPSLSSPFKRSGFEVYHQWTRLELSRWPFFDKGGLFSELITSRGGKEEAYISRAPLTGLLIFSHRFS
ncbi:hypothetical protein ACLOJK_019265 [Asimina triloba]